MVLIEAHLSSSSVAPGRRTAAPRNAYARIAESEAAAFGGEITYVTRGRGHHRAAGIVPADLVERYEELIDREDGRIASERLADIEAGRVMPVSADEVARTLTQ